MYGSSLSLTSVLDVAGWLTARPGRFNPGRLGGLQDRSGRVQNMSPSPGLDTRTVHPIPIRYALSKCAYSVRF